MEPYQTKDGKTFIIREPVESDAQQLIDYSKLVFASTDQVLTTPDEYTITLDNEIKWIESMNAEPDALLLIATMAETIVGFLFFIPNKKRKISHTGEFGVNVHPHYRGNGIGRRLIEALLAWAHENQQIEKVILQVFATNTSAIGLYHKLGFVDEGRHVKAIKQLDGSYVDIIQMYKETPARW